MATQEVTKPIALDETLQDTNTALGLLGKDTTLQSIVTALAGIGINTVGNLASLVTTDKTSLVGAVNELAGDISDLDTDKADKVDSATAGNLAGLNGSGNLTDSGWNGAKGTTSISGNPISISGLKSNQLAVNPVITLEPIQAGSGTPSPSNIRAISGYDKIEVLSCGVNVWDEEWEVGTLNSSTGEPVSYSNRIRSKNFNRCIGGASYYGYIGFNDSLRIMWYDIARNFIPGAPTTTGGIITAPANACYFKLTTEGTTYGETYRNDIGLNYPATQTSYVASNKTTSISESLGQTVYKGSLEVRTGKFDVWYDALDLGNFEWDKDGDNRYYHRFAGYNMAIVRGSTVADLICEIYPAISPSAYTERTTSGATIMVSNSVPTIMIYDANYNDTGANFQTYVAGKKLAYRKITPTTIQLTPHEISLLKDYAYVSTNGTNIALDYHNGELASLGDVSQLGETVNELGNNIKNVRELFTYTFNGTTTWQSALYDISQKLKLLSWADMRRLQLQYDTDNRIFNIVKINASNWQFSITCLDGTSYIDTFVAVLDAINLSENKFVMIRVQDDSSVTYRPLATVAPSNGTVIKVLLT